MTANSAGKKFRAALEQESPLKLIGVINAYCAKLALNTGFKAIYLSGAGVANSNFGLPDLGLTGLRDVVVEVEKITHAVDLPLIVDGDTGFGGELNTAYTVEKLIKSGAAGVHFEDQAWPKRCGHRDGKKLISSNEMQAKIKAAVDSKNKLDKDFVIIARTDALAVEGMDKAIERAKAYVANGADAIFAEAITEIDQYKQFTKSLDVPVIANITEFGKTPLFSSDELKDAGVKIMLFPLSAFRAMNKAAQIVFSEIKNNGSQKNILDKMETREELYKTLDYYNYESKA